MSHYAPGSPYGQARPPGQYGASPPPYGQALPGPYGAPPSPYGQTVSQAPPTYRSWAIACCVGGVLFSLIIGLPCALAALRHANRVQPAWAAGDQQAALKASRSARTWAIVSTVFELLGLILIIVLISHSGSTTTS